MKTIILKNEELHRKIKIYSIENKISMVEAVETALSEFVDRRCDLKKSKG